MSKRRERGRAASTVLTAVCLTALMASAQPEAATRLSSTRITLRATDLPLGNILNQIARSAKLALVVDKDVRTELRVPAVELDGVPLDSALAMVLTPLGYSYEVDAERSFLRVYVYSSRTFRIAIPVVVQAWRTCITDGDKCQPTATEMAPGIELYTRSDTNGLWEEIERSLSRLLHTGREGEGAVGGGAAQQKDAARLTELGSFSINRVAGFVTVRALPTLMPTIEAYFAALNREVGKTVTVETRVMQVDLNDDRAAGVDWSAAALQLGPLFLGGSATLAPSAGNSVFAGQTSSSPPTFRLSGRAGDAFLRALEQQGKVRVLAQPTLMMGNNLPSIIELAQVQAYVSQITTTVVQGTAAAQTTVQTSSLSDGLIVSVIPRILDDGEVSLGLVVVLQDVLQVTPFAFQGGAVQLPQTARRSYGGVIRGKVNETHVLGGLITTRKESRHSGVPFLSRVPILGIFFGTVEEVERKSELVLTVTPREVQSVREGPPPVRVAPEGF